jgi:hypothetical protein
LPVAVAHAPRRAAEIAKAASRMCRKYCVAEAVLAFAGQGAVAPLYSKEPTASDGDAAMRERGRSSARAEGQHASAIVQVPPDSKCDTFEGEVERGLPLPG